MRRCSLIVMLLLGCTPAGSASAENVQVAPFSSIQLRNGAEVRVAYGENHRVTIVEGDAQRAVLHVENGRLRIDRCPGRCSHREPFLVEVVTPRLDGVEVEEGGRLIVLEGFPRQSQLTAAVANGGTLDARGLAADQVTAAVAQGGIILARPRDRLTAAVNQGGAITYWGDPAVTRSIRNGGVVQRGSAEESARPLEEMMPDPKPVPPVPPVPPLD